MTDDERYEKLREVADALRANLPKSIDVAALGVMSKVPFQVLSLREALIWRTDELLHSAIQSLEQKDISVSAMLARALIENTALLFRLVAIFEKRVDLDPQELNDQLMALLFGSREWSDGPQAINILTCVGHANEEFEGLDKIYAELSEYAHPNWKGVMGLYSKLDRENHRARFGREFVGYERIKSRILSALLIAAILFKHRYNKISDDMPDYLKTLEPIWPELANDRLK